MTKQKTTKITQVKREAGKKVPSDIAIAQASKMTDIREIARTVGLKESELTLHGKHIAKINRDKWQDLIKNGKKDGRLILVTAMNPTPAGEGKTTTSVGLADALRVIGKKSMLCLREPSLGPCFGMKGGAAGGGYAQVLPMEEINLHFTGDFHAIGLANNLLSAAIDNHVQQGNALNIDPRRITWTRVVDMNDRALRNVIVGLGGVMNSMPHEAAFEITVASEIMACFCLAENIADLKRRLGNITIGLTYDRRPVFARDLNVHGAMTALLRDALNPNLVQTIEHTPAFVHGGPFANIAHGTNSVIATKTALKLADYVVTEAGFGSDLGAEKFMNIVCRKARFKPDVVVIVATIRALKMNGGMPKKELTREDLDALEKGLGNLKKHIENMHNFGLPVVVSLNRFITDTKKEIKLMMEKCAHLGVTVVESNVWEQGGQGGVELAKSVLKIIDEMPTDFTFLYEDSLNLWKKVERIGAEIYGAMEVEADKKIRKKFQDLQDNGFGHLPICVAKTQYSLSSDPGLLGRPKHFDLHVRDVRVASGAEFVIVYCGDIMTMPGLPRKPAAEVIDVDENGRISGLF
jgi:formate--tetrahydrofolate ligase